jgi:hypothetical protein
MLQEEISFHPVQHVQPVWRWPLLQLPVIHVLQAEVARKCE